MKRIFLLYIALLLTQQLQCDPLLVVVLMVKNEQAAIEQTLRPFAAAGIDSYLILDTGSTDNTIAVTNQFFATHGIHNGFIEQQPFVDFATSRNYALQCAEQRFPNAEFMLMLDAEWRLHNVQELLQFCAAHIQDTEPSYLVRLIMASSLEFYTPRLIRARCGVRFEGVVHEVLHHVTKKKVHSGVCFYVQATAQSREKTKKRWLRDRDLLLKEYERNPHDNRTVFYLAQTYECLDDWYNACIYYAKRCEMVLGGEEDFMARYKLAQMYQGRNMWPEALCNYMHAYSMRPSRAEPLIRIADYYCVQKQYTLAFLFACHACQVPYPSNDILFVEKEHYDYTRFDILGNCAWHVGEYATGLWAVRNALAADSGALHLVKNLQLYVAKQPLDRKPRVSIITSVFKGDSFIQGFMADIVQQSIFKECELIIINANSPGNEEQIITQYQKQYPNIIYIKLPMDPGLYEVWNIGLSIASSDFITNANLDDRRNPFCMEVQAITLENNAAVDLVYGDYLMTQTPNELFKNSGDCLHAHILDFAPYNMGYCLPGPQPMWRKSMHAKYGFFSTQFSSFGDHEFWCRAVCAGARFKKIHNFLTGVYYENPHGLSNKREITDERDCAMQKLIQIYGHLWQSKK